MPHTPLVAVREAPDHALVEKFAERLGAGYVAEIMERLVPEPRRKEDAAPACSAPPT